LFGLLIMPAHFLMLTILPLLLLGGFIGMLLLLFFAPTNYVLIGTLTGVVVVFIFSPQFQAFIKTQLVLIIATVGCLLNLDTQTFARIASTRR
jgi:hypothetical protein